MDEVKQLQSNGVSLLEAMRETETFDPLDAPAPPALARRPESKCDAVQFDSGILVSKDGKILTNAHVVQGCVQTEIKTVGSAPSIARVLDVDQTNDLALLKADMGGRRRHPSERTCASVRTSTPMDSRSPVS